MVRGYLFSSIDFIEQQWTNVKGQLIFEIKIVASKKHLYVLTKKNNLLGPTFGMKRTERGVSPYVLGKSGKCRGWGVRLTLKTLPKPLLL